jgi:transcriptional antiterminator RfaH
MPKIVGGLPTINSTAQSAAYPYFLKRGGLMKEQRGLYEICWYLVQTHARQEDRAENNLKSFGIETLAPRFRERRHNFYSGEVTYHAKPLFPSYIFAKFRVNDLYHKVQYTRGVRQLISFGDHPAVIDEEIITMIQSRIREEGFAMMEADEGLKPGDEVLIKGGPLSNFAGVFEYEMKDADRVRILLQTVSYQAHVEVAKDSVVKLNRSRSRT